MNTEPKTSAVEMVEVEAAPALVVSPDIDQQIATARRYPRSITKFLKKAQELACLDEATAESCIYALPRSGKTIEGPSARFAEIVASAYGNLRVEGKPIAINEQFVTSRGVSWDLENNVAIAFEVQRRITDKNGRRYNDDMIGVTANAATSIALRNAVLKDVPAALWRPIYEACRKTAVGDAQTLVKRRDAMLDWFQKAGVAATRIFELLVVKGVEDITLEHLAVLKGLATAIREGDTTVEAILADFEQSHELRQPQRKSQATTAGSNGGSAVPTPGSSAPAANPPKPAADPLERIIDVKPFGEGAAKYWGITTSRGRKAGTRDEAMAAACISHQGKATPLEITIDPNPKPNTLPKLLEILPLTTEAVA